MIQKLGHYALRVKDLERSVQFYTQVVGLDLTEGGECAYLRRGRDHHVLALYPIGYRNPLDPGSPEAPGLDHVAFAVPDARALGEAAQGLKAHGVAILFGPDEVDEPGHPVTLRFLDPEGYRVEVFARMDQVVGPERPHAVKPQKLGHIILHATDVQRQFRFYTEVLGFKLSDWVADFFVFLRCNPDHHALGFVSGKRPRLNHAAFEVRNIEEMKNAADLCWKEGTVISWGLGRHGPGHNLFIYYNDPEGNTIEIFSELDQIHDDATYRPLVWPPDVAADVWSRSIPERFIREH